MHFERVYITLVEHIKGTTGHVRVLITEETARAKRRAFLDSQLGELSQGRQSVFLRLGNAASCCRLTIVNTHQAFLPEITALLHTV